MGLIATSYIPTVAAPVTRNADVLTFPWTAVPQAMTVYLRFLELGNITNGIGLVGSELFQIGPNAGPRLLLNTSGAVYTLTHQTGGGTVGSSVGAIPANGNTVELLGTLSAGGVVQLQQSVNGGTPNIGAASSALVLVQAWGTAVLTINSAVAAAVGFTGFQRIQFARGIQSLGTMQRYAAVL